AMGVALDLKTRYGMRNFEQINTTMAGLTGVDASQEAVRNSYLAVRNQLPTGNELASFLSTSQVSIAKLAAVYCDSALEQAPLRNNLLGSFDISKKPQEAFAVGSREELFRGLTARFWGKIDEILPEQGAVQGELNKLTDDL